MSDRKCIRFDYSELQYLYPRDVEGSAHDYRNARGGDERTRRDFFFHRIALRFRVDPEFVTYDDLRDEVTIELTARVPA